MKHMHHKLAWCSFYSLWNLCLFISFPFWEQLFLRLPSLTFSFLCFLFPSFSLPPLRPEPHSDTQLLGSWSLWLAGRSQENLCARFATHCHIPFNLPTFPSSSWEITSLSAVYTSTPFCLHAALSTLICRLCKCRSLRPLWQGTVTAWCVILV